MKVKTVPVNSISQDPANLRKHGERNIDAIVASLRKFGQQHPIVIDNKGIILSGNGRYLAAVKLGWHEIQVVESDLTGSSATAYAIADNRTAELAEWDTTALAETLRALQSEEFDTDAAGYSESEIDALVEGLGSELLGADKEIVEDEVPEPPVDPITKAGDLWILGEHRVLCGDSTNAEDVERLMNGAKADLCFTSPPYADMRKYSGSDLCVENLATIFYTFKQYCELYLVNLGLQLKNDEIYPYWDQWIQVAKGSGLKMLSWLVWDRINATSVSSQQKMFAITHEWIFVFGTKSFDINRTWEKSESSEKRAIYYKTNPSGQKVTTRRQKDGSVKESVIGEVYDNKNMGTVFTCYAEMRRELNHPARFPIEFPTAYIEAITSESDLICEPFLGSGTTLIAAEQLNRKCFGMEISPQYCDVIVKRWENLTGMVGVRETPLKPVKV